MDGNLEARLRRLEAALEGAVRPRGSVNLAGAARYLGISDETLRRLHQCGAGPVRSRRGERGWTYRIADLDAFLEARREPTAA